MDSTRNSFTTEDATVYMRGTHIDTWSWCTNCFQSFDGFLADLDTAGLKDFDAAEILNVGRRSRVSGQEKLYSKIDRFDERVIIVFSIVVSVNINLHSSIVYLLS